MKKQLKSILASAVCGLALSVLSTSLAQADPQQIITAKAAALGLPVTGNAVSGLETVPTGHRIRYQNCDIYYSPAAGAHGIHGAIRDKYNAMGGPFGHMGLPIMDELGTSDGIGRYSEVSFPGKAIYWSPDTGPFALEGDMRRIWVANGAERSRFGYPIAEAQRGNGNQWGDFQNDVIYFEGSRPRTPRTAGLTQAQLINALRNFIRARLNLQGGIYEVTIDRFQLLEVSKTGYDFNKSRNRLVTVRLEGHYRLPDYPDPHYNMDLQFLLFPYREADGSTTLRIGLTYHYSVADAWALGPGGLTTVLARFEGSFASPPKLIDVNVPAGISVLSFKVLRDGEIKLFMQPDGGAEVVQLAVQLALDRLAK